MEKYPGSNTEFFIIVNGATVGPIVGMKGLFEYPIVVDTPVWYDGLDDWMPISLAPLTAPLFADSAFRNMVLADTVETPQPAETTDESSIPDIPEQIPELPQGTPPPVDNPAPAPHPYAATATTIASAVQNIERKPKSYLGWAIAATVLCNFIAGIVAIIFATKVNSKFLRGDLEGSRRCSETTQWWIAISFTAGLIMIVANLFAGRLF